MFCQDEKPKMKSDREHIWPRIWRCFHSLRISWMKINAALHCQQVIHVILIRCITKGLWYQSVSMFNLPSTGTKGWVERRKPSDSLYYREYNKRQRPDDSFHLNILFNFSQRSYVHAKGALYTDPFTLHCTYPQWHKGYTYMHVAVKLPMLLLLSQLLSDNKLPLYLLRDGVVGWQRLLINLHWGVHPSLPSRLLYCHSNAIACIAIVIFTMHRHGENLYSNETHAQKCTTE